MLQQHPSESSILAIVAEIEKAISDREYCYHQSRNPVTWGGAGVIVTTDPRDGNGAFVLETRHAVAVAWYFERIKKLTYKAGLLNYFSKGQLFMDLAEAVSILSRDDSVETVLSVLLDQTRRSLNQILG
jgi:hypothetical protein